MNAYCRYYVIDSSHRMVASTYDRHAAIAAVESGVDMMVMADSFISGERTGEFALVMASAFGGWRVIAGSGDDKIEEVFNSLSVALRVAAGFITCD